MLLGGWKHVAAPQGKCVGHVCVLSWGVGPSCLSMGRTWDFQLMVSST